MRNQQACWRRLRDEMRANGIAVIDAGEVTPEEKQWLDSFFLDQIFPVLTPMAMDPAHPFPFIPNLGFAIVLDLRRPEDKRQLRALIVLPPQIARFIRLPGQAIRFLPLETLVGMYLDRLFPGFEVTGLRLFPHDPRQRDRNRGGGRGSRPPVRDGAEAPAPRLGHPSQGQCGDAGGSAAPSSSTSST